MKDYKSINGQLDIKVGEEREIFFLNNKIQKELNQELLSKFNKQLKLLKNDLNSLVVSLEEIFKNCQILFSVPVIYGENNDF